jgi:3-hydroxyacyl-CoA dehydrogenase
MAVSIERAGRVALVTVDNPPVNALSQEVRAGLLEAFRTLAAEPAEAVAILATGRTFIAGADIREFSGPRLDPPLPEVLSAIEALPVPVVAVLHGTALGGGFEVALAAHARVALPGTRVGLPEINLGIFPGAGGTQRTPRLAGVVTAVDLILSGRHVPAEEALDLGLVDRIMQGTPREVALAAADAALAGTLPVRRTSSLPAPEPSPDLIATRRKALEGKPGSFAALRALDAIEAASGPFDAGMAQERALFEACRASPERSALVHIFFAEREAPKVETGAEPRPVEQIGVIGGGTMGSGISAAALLSGYAVTIVERDAAAAERGRKAVAAVLDGAEKRGRLTAEARAGMVFRTSTDYADLALADLVIEAAFEDMDVKRDIFRRLDAVAKPGAVLATNTSYLDVDAIAAVTERPGDVVGLHFFSPAYIMKLVEVVIAAETAPEVTATAFAVAKRLGKIAVPSGNADGFIGNRIFTAYRRTADILMEDGASPYAIDAALRAWGLPMGPYEAGDLAGQDIGWAARKRRAPTRDPAERYVRIPDLVCERGWFGRKTGRGFYRYPEGAKTGEPDDEVLALVAAERERRGISPRDFAPEEIVRRVLLTMVNEGARALEAGIARRASDIDVVLVNGYGFPRFRGGPMKAAEGIGDAAAVLDALSALAREDPVAFRPSGWIEAMAGKGLTLL